MPTYFITFSTYGQWLHGARARVVDRHHNQPGRPLLPRTASARRGSAS
jgi:hypothetical protein